MTHPEKNHLISMFVIAAEEKDASKQQQALEHYYLMKSLEEERKQNAENYRQQKAGESKTSKPNKSFNNFEGRHYNMDELERQLLMAQ